jgi:hypothetical protein
VNVAELTPLGTVTEGGTLIAVLLLESETAAPPVGAAWFSVAVQLEEPPDTSAVGLQVSADRNTPDPTVMTPPLAVTVTGWPGADAPRTFTTATENVGEFVETVILKLATAPFGIVLLFKPVKMHMYEPEPFAQLMDFPAELAAAPTVAVIAEAAAGGYDIVHCNPATLLLPVDVSERDSEVVPPGVVAAEDSDREVD